MFSACFPKRQERKQKLIEDIPCPQRKVDGKKSEVM
jgi:hypothetical protein